MGCGNWQEEHVAGDLFCSSWQAGYVPAEAASWWEPPKKPVWMKGDWELLPAGNHQNPGAR